MKKMLILTTGAAIAVVGGAVSAKPLALLGLGSLVMSVWSLTFSDMFRSDLFSEQQVDTPSEG